MTVRLFFLLFVAFLLSQGCSNAPANTQKAPQGSTTPVASAPAAQPTAGKLNIDLSEEPAKPEPSANTAPATSHQPVYKPVPTPEGPSGYISRNNVVLQNNPSATSPATGHFKIYEEVIILETLSKDEQGNNTEVPMWYKVRCKDRRVGWVVARSVTVN